MLLPKEVDAAAVELGEDEVYVFPLSFGQQRLWVLERLEPNTAAYNIPIFLRLRGELKLEALRDSLSAILRRHEVLRSTFGEQDGKPVQIVPLPAPTSLPFTDLSEIPLGQREAHARSLAREEAQKPFDVSRGPVFRASLLKLEAHDHLLLLTVHHIVFDGWSQGILLQELFSHYAAFANQQPLTLPEPPIQYSDFAIWQRDNLSGEKLQAQLEYWRQQLSGAPPSLELPLDHPRPPHQTFRGGQYSLLLSPTILHFLQDLSRHEGATFFMTLLAAFSMLLARYSGQEDLVIGSPIAGRNRAEVERLIGFFVNTLALRTDLTGNVTFRQLLVRVRETCLKAYAHQDVPFEKLVEELKPERDASRNPIFQVMFALQNVPVEEKKIAAGLAVERFSAGESTTSKFEISLFALERPDGLRLVFEYNTDLFDRATIERMAQHFQTLLEGIVADPDLPIADLPWLSEAERQQVLVEWNHTQEPYPERCIHDLFEAQTEQTPDNIALVFNNQEISYRELNSRANQLAHYIGRLDLGPEALVAVSMERSFEMVVALLGILKAGAAYVPLDPAYPRERLHFMLSDSAAPLLLTNQRSSDTIQANVRRVDLDKDRIEIARESADNPATRTSPDNLAYVLYTSGSTGQPKGVMGTHRGAVNRFSWMWRTYPFEPGETCCQKTSLNFVDSVWEIFGPLLRGVKSVIIPDEILKDTPSLVRFLAAQEVTRLVLVPSLLRTICDMCPELQTKLPSLRYLVSSGEALPSELAQTFLTALPHAVLLNLYGSTEVSADCTYYEVHRSLSLSSVPIGKPMSNTQVYMLDRNRQVVPIGVAGELYVAGDGLARGYLRRPELTAERFIDNPFTRNAIGRLFRTGDRARFLPDGNIEYLGRSDFQVKIRGFRIELGEVESALARHPAIKEVVVTAREDEPGNKRLVAYVVPAEGQQVSRETLRSHLRQSLPDYMLPAQFVSMAAFPLTPNGKVNRRALPQPQASSDENVAATTPRNDREAVLLEIWRELLGLDSIGLNQDFFDLGGHSLLAVRLMSRIEKASGRKLPLATLFQTSTIESLARELHAGSMAADQIVLQIQGKGSKPPFFGIVVPGMNALGYVSLARQLGEDQPFYRIQGPGARLKGRPYTPVEFEGIADEYIKAMKTVQPAGPYYLGGMCEGARIAFDMARLLERRGDTVGLLAIFDTWVLENSQIRSLWKINYYSDRIKRIYRLPRKQMQETIRKVLRNRARGLYPTSATQRTSLSSWPATYWPGKTFVPATFTGKITVFKRRKQPYFYVRDPLLGWGTRTTAGVELHVIDPYPDQHVLIFREPYVAQLARQLLDCLERARETSSLAVGDEPCISLAAS
jgi:amino acid adenylation domain-containing protein